MGATSIREPARPRDASNGTATASLRAQLRDWLWRWLWRSPLPEPAPIVLGQRRIFVLPTAAGLAYAGALLVMLLASINYNLALGYGLVFLLAAIAFVSIIHAFRNLLGLSIRPGRSEPVFAGEPAHFVLLMENQRQARRPSLRLRCPPHPATELFSVAPQQTTATSVLRPTQQRGWLSLGRVVIETTWPIGLIRAWSVIAPDMRCLVYPAPEVNPPPLPTGPTGGPGEGAVQRGDDDFAGLRNHQPVDPPRHVAWKAVARGGPMLTKHFAGLAGGELQLDWESLPARLDAEARAARLTAWVLAAQASGQPFALKLPDNSHGPVGLGPPHVQDCLTRLALFAAPRGNDSN